MVLKTFWGSVGLLLGSLGGLLGGSWGLLGASRSTNEGLQIRLGTLLGLVCLLLAAEDCLGKVLGPHLARFGAPEGLLGGVLASVKPISTIKTAFPIFDILFFLALVLVILLLLLLVRVRVLALPLALALALHFTSLARITGRRDLASYLPSILQLAKLALR